MRIRKAVSFSKPKDLSTITLNSQFSILNSPFTPPNLPFIHHHCSNKIEPSLNPQPNILLVYLRDFSSHGIYLYITIDTKCGGKQIAKGGPKRSHATPWPR